MSEDGSERTLKEKVHRGGSAQEEEEAKLELEMCIYRWDVVQVPFLSRVQLRPKRDRGERISQLL